MNHVSDRAASLDDPSVGLRRAGRIMLAAIIALLAAGGFVSVVAISIMLKLQDLNYEAQRNLDNWRYLADRSRMMMTNKEMERAAAVALGLARDSFRTSLARVDETQRDIDRIVRWFGQRALHGGLGFIDTPTLNEFVRNNIDPRLVQDVRSLGNEYYDGIPIDLVRYTALNLALQNGEMLNPLYKRLSLAAKLNRDSVRPVIATLTSVIGGIIMGIWLLWRRSLSPALTTLRDKAQSLLSNSEELTETNRELMRKNAQVLAAQRMAHIGYWFKEGDAPPSFSDGAAAVLGISEESLPKQLEDYVLLSPPDDAERLTITLSWLGQHDGAEEFSRTISSPQYGSRIIRERIESRSDGGVRHMMGILFDITETLNASKQTETADRIELIELVAAGVAHDFNNILSIIQGHAELIHLNGENAARSVQAILDATRTAAAITGQLRVRVSLSDDHQAVISAREVLRTCITSLSKSTPDVDIRWQQPQGRDFTIRANRGLLENAILNIFNNAREATPNGAQIDVIVEDVDPSALLRIVENPGKINQSVRYARIAIRDRGPGMPQNILRRAVEPFFSTKHRGDGARGRGLGLWSVFSFMSSQNGFLDISSTPGQGTTVSLIFPTDAAVQHRSDAPAPARHSTNLQGKSVLLVEDEAALATVMSEMLQALGCRTVAARNGPEVRARLADKAKFDLLVVDVNLGQGATGLDLAIELSESDPDMRIIVISGLLSRDEFEPYVQRGWQFLQKPFPLSEFEDALARVQRPDDARQAAKLISSA